MVSILLLLSKLNLTIFDMPKHVNELENLYFEMWNDFSSNKLPKPNLSNLEIYHDISISLDHESLGLVNQTNYFDKYKEEITADLYGIWMLKKYFEKHFMKDAWIRSNFREENLKKIFSDIKKVAPHMCSAGTSHPNCDFRGHLIDKFLEISFWQDQHQMFLVLHP